MITIFKGDSIEVKLSVLDGANPMDLTGYSSLLIIKHSFDSRIVYLEKGHDVAKSELNSGNLFFIILKEDSEKMPVGEHVYSVIIEKPNFRKTIKVGEFKIKNSLVDIDPGVVFPVR